MRALVCKLHAIGLKGGGVTKDELRVQLEVARPCLVSPSRLVQHHIHIILIGDPNS